MRRLRTFAWKKFDSQRSDAFRRGIGFFLTFEQWITIWKESGHWKDRGVYDGQYCMARFEDKGPYAVGNVEIITVNQNHHDGNIGKSKPKDAEWRRHISEAKIGEKHTEEHNRKIGVSVSIALKGVSKSAEHIAAISASKMRMTPERRSEIAMIANLAQLDEFGHKIKKRTPEHNAKIRVGILKAFAEKSCAERRGQTQQFCSFPNCTRPHYAKGYCSHHYYHFKRGDL